jgi:rare lipoprotein A
MNIKVMRSLIILLSITGLSLTGTDPIVCSATWYNMHGAKTASGERMHKDSLTAAYNSKSFGTKLEITNLDNLKVCTVRVTDRMGNNISGKIDLSYAAFGKLANHGQGRIKVKIKEI